MPFHPFELLDMMTLSPQDSLSSRWVGPLLAWYEHHKRDMPWRAEPSPYKVWISEIMLQQTQVDTVIPYFQRFLTRFPDVHALAAADEQEVLKLWQGLGYYSRARRLHACAKHIRQGQSLGWKQPGLQGELVHDCRGR